MLGIIGGSGLTELANLDISHREVVRTPFGDPSGAITFGQLSGQPAMFLARHGYGHTIPPHGELPRQHLGAVEQGARGIVSVASVGGIRADLSPGDLVVPAHQIIDWHLGRRSTYHEGEGCTVTMSISPNPLIATCAR